MKKLFFTTLCLLCVHIVFAQYMTLKGNQLYDSTGAPFYVKGVNYTIDLHNTSASLTGAVLKPAFYYYHTTRPTYYEDSAGIKDIAADFRFIRDSLGCNTIRLCVSVATVDSCGSSFFRAGVRIGDGTITTRIAVTDLTFMTPYYQALLDTAAACHVKIVLLLWSFGSQCFDNSTLQTIYNNYLIGTASALKNKKALLAYDNWNEPEYVALPGKDVVCSFSGTWYAYLKAYDPNHLVTAGLLGTDVRHWGIDVYAADFYSIHQYCNSNKAQHYSNTLGSYIVDSVTDYNHTSDYEDRFNTFARFMSKVSSRPWMIGETSFGANLYPDFSHPDSANYYKKADGDTGAQAAYLTNVYTTVKQYGGMGCLWWCFMDGKGYSYYKDVDPTDPANNFYGLLSNNRKIKPAGYALKNFNVNGVVGSGPAYPGNYQNLLGHGGTAITGKVTSSGADVPNAMVTGWRRQPNPITGKSEQLWVDDVVTNETEGNFSITSLTPVFPNLPPSTQINVLEMGAAGYNIGSCDASTPATSGNMPAGKHYNITKTTTYDMTYTGTHLSANTNNPPVTDPDKLTLTDFYVSASTGGTVYTATVIAANEIAVLPSGTTDSYVAQTAEAAFYNLYLGSDCSDPVWASYDADRHAGTNAGGTKPPLTAGAAQMEGNQQLTAKTVYLNAEGFLLQVYPNPATDMVLLQSAKSINLVMFCNMYGATVAQYNLQGATQQSININTFTPGTYIIKILYNDNTSTYTQIIKL